MTHILAQSVYGLDLKDLPLQRLLKEESMIGRRHRTPSAAPPELSPTNFNSFSDIKASTNTGSLPLGSRSAEERRSQAMRHKSRTVDVPQTPDSPQQGRSRRYVSIPVDGGELYQLPVKTATVGGGSRKGRSISEAKGPGSSQDIPARPSSSEDHYRTILEEGGEEEEEKGILSPPISLPDTVLLGGTTETVANHSPPLSLQRSEREDEVDSSSGTHQEGRVEESLAISDDQTHSPTPEVQSPGLTFERGSSVEPLIEATTTSERPKEKTRRSLFGRNRNRSDSALGGGGGEGRSRRKSASAAAAKVDRDLVFANESSEDPATLLAEGEGEAIERKSPVDVIDGGKGLPPPFRKRRGESPMSSLTASWTAGVRKRQRGMSERDESGMEEEERRRSGGGRVYKSSSEGNIDQLGLLSEEGGAGEVEEEEGGREDSRSVAGTPASSRSQKKTNMSVGFSPQDFFSSSIIPSSQARLLSSPVGPRSQSPVLPSSLSPVHPSSLPSPHTMPVSQLALRRGSGQIYHTLFNSYWSYWVSV